MRNKTEILYILLLIIFVIVAFFLFRENIYSPYSDIGREMYITEQVKNGLVLYKDIFNVYSPLGYWLNAIIIKFFGNNLNIFYGIGLTLSILTIIPIFLISRAYTNKHLAFFISLFIITSCTFYPSISNWITPYSYSIVYALSSTIWGFFFLYKFATEKKQKDLYLASFLSGLSLCFKYEFILFFILILAISIKEKEHWKTILSFWIMPIISILILFIQGCSFTDLKEAITIILELGKSESAKYFYNYAGIYPSIENMKNSLISLAYPNFKNIFAPICIVNIFLLLINLKKKNHLLSILLLSGLMVSIKSLGGIQFEIYGTYFFPLLFIGLIATLYKKEKNIRTIYLSTICLLLTICYFAFSYNTTQNLKIVETKKGNIKISNVYYKSTLDFLQYIEDIEQNKKILILPEGAFINYLQDKSSDNWLYYLIPPNTNILKKEFIEKKIKSKEIDYIVTTNIQYPWFNEKSFMTSWGKEYLHIIKENYNQEIIIGENLKFYIYKRDIIK